MQSIFSIVVIAALLPTAEAEEASLAGRLEMLAPRAAGLAHVQVTETKEVDTRPGDGPLFLEVRFRILRGTGVTPDGVNVVKEVGGHPAPNALPFETIQLSPESARAKIPGEEHKLRPWLQDFTYGDPEYGESEVRAQIDATAEEIGFGYMLCNANVEFTTEALGADG